MTVSQHSILQSDLFLCHSSKDKDFVRRLALDLRELYVDAWFDEWELQPGDSLIDCIGAALEQSVYVGIVMSPHSVESNWCKKELNQALSRELRFGENSIIPIRLGSVDVPTFLQEKYYLDFSTDYYLALTKLSATIQQLDSRLVNVKVNERPPKSTSDINLIFGGLISKEFEPGQESWGSKVAYRRLKKLIAIRPTVELLSWFGQLCYEMNRDREALGSFRAVLDRDESFANFSEINAHVRELARQKKPFEMDLHSRIALAYTGVIQEDQDYVLNAAYGSNAPEVLFAAGTYFLGTEDADVEAAIAYFINATKNLSVDSPWVRRCDETIFRILHEKHVCYPKPSWEFIKACVAEWNEHKWALT